MRLLFVSHSFPPPDEPSSNLGGMQRVATDLHAALLRSDSVSLSSQLLETTWASTHRRIPRFLFSTFLRLRRDIKSGTVDAVLFSSMVTAMLTLLTSRRARRDGVLLAAIVHGLDVTTPVSPYQWLVRKVFKRIDLVFPVSSATARACVDRGLDPDRCSVVPNGISEDRFGSQIERAAARQILLEKLDTIKSPDPIVLCSVGRQVRRKGFDWFIRNVMPLLPEHVHYVLAGDGPEAATIADAATEAGIEHRTHMLGRVSEDDLQVLYAASDLFIMPNIHVPGDMEGFGVVMLEAALANLPVIAANIEGIADVIDHGQNGLLIESQNVEAFANAITSLLLQPDELASLSSRSKTSVLERFSWSNVAGQYVEIISERINSLR
ncbi:MAG: glycosyltransferase family 4 protein [Rhodothermales bacterium]|nr:glycosyltransferase family 4 protein [Rhodothermales bacterium]